ncbi:hypothetical protein [Paenibacillus lentus]|uniref:Uncharacterized protein n=1 Tax=Paenibacillus lentus TaxID=1338368 RepID=A0A3Q8SDZ2_9BACL|nr:hypothetical protein [Paenibacillus lentus]AZK48502.1 hypothetical protein EIM92_21910 [Paenibacillus lentus]
MIRVFKSKDHVEAVEFKDFSSIHTIILLTGMGVSVNFSPKGALSSLTLIKGAHELVAIPGQFVYKNDTGTVGICNYEYLAERYEEVTETEIVE